MNAPVGDGGPAFSRPYSHDTFNDDTCHSQTGMYLGDFFAAKAMHALITALDGPSADDPSPMRDANLAVTAADDIAKHAYLYAAAMLKARTR